MFHAAVGRLVSNYRINNCAAHREINSAHLSYKYIWNSLFGSNDYVGRHKPKWVLIFIRMNFRAIVFEGNVPILEPKESFIVMLEDKVERVGQIM